ncbi:MAG TPA: hypothetical protein DDZ51_19745 [Planctomycetaceae bacterium]|nr:hypothetical protein [Planctomycetaceae bacterium]
MRTDVSWVTTEQLLAMPDDGVDRELIHGELRENATTKRNRFHTRTVSRLTYILERWLDTKLAF